MCVKQNRGFVTKLLVKLAAKKRKAAPQARLFQSTAAQYSEAVSRAFQAAEIKNIAFVPHQLRHGGPSCDYMARKRFLAEIQKRGRWQAATSVRRYEKSATYSRQLARLTPVQLSRAARLQHLC